MKAQELIDLYRALNKKEATIFDILYKKENEILEQEIQEALNSNRITYAIPIGQRDEQAAKLELASLISDYKEEIHIPENIEISTNDSLIGVQFTEQHIKDNDRLKKMIELEATQIHKNSKDGRSLDTIKFCVRQGKIAELWLIENRGYEVAGKKYHDLIDSNGDYTEVKAYDVDDINAPHIQKDIKRLKEASWNISKWYIVFKFKYGVYTFLDKIQLR